MLVLHQDQCNRESIIVSVGQFRKEKDHMMQLDAFSKFIRNFPERILEDGNEVLSRDDISLVMIGSVRKHKKGDSRRVERLKERAKALGIEVRISDASLMIKSRVSIIVDAPGAVMKSWLSRATVGIHTMRDEHFGISVVELMVSLRLTRLLA